MTSLSLPRFVNVTGSTKAASRISPDARFISEKVNCFIAGISVSRYLKYVLYAIYAIRMMITPTLCFNGIGTMEEGKNDFSDMQAWDAVLHTGFTKATLLRPAVPTGDRIEPRWLATEGALSSSVQTAREGVELALCRFKNWLLLSLRPVKFAEWKKRPVANLPQFV
jgi:hypothetical protein